MAANGGIKGKVNKPSHGGNVVTTMKASGNFAVQQGTTEVDVLTVAGGGGSGGDQGAGGGGAGGFRNLTRQHVLANSNIAITVGAGGAAGGTGTPEDGSSGANSVFGNPANPITSAGGGGGGLGDSGGGGTGVDGGSGGGGGGRGDDAGGSGTSGQGNDGGKSKPQSSPTNDRGGGGGGAGAAGTDGANDPGAAGNGGNGSPSTITGTATHYAGGGGGGSESTGGTSGGAGGVGGGGPGGNGAAGTAGTANTGGGGGASGSAPVAGGAGGSGIVIIKEKDKASGVWNMKNQYSSKIKGQWPDPNQYEITNSCRFDDGDTDYLNRTRISQSNTTATFSVWTKMGNINADNVLFGGHTDVNNRGYIYFSDPDGYVGIFSRTSGSADINYASNGKFRDATAWYHVVVSIDTTQATAADRFKMYINGKQYTDWGTETAPSQDASLPILNKAAQTVGGGYGSSAVSSMSEGYLADFYYIDGQALHCGNFGEPDPDNPTIWRPKKYEGTFGAAGFKLEFKQTGTGTAGTGTIGADTSGNLNHLTSNNLESLNIVEDTPTNNFATMNPLDNFHSGFTFSQGNCKFLTAGSANAYNTATIGDLKQGKWYLEVKYTDPSSTGSGGSLQYYGAISAIGHKLSDGVSDTDTSTDLYATSYLHNFGYDANNGRIKNNNQAGTVHGAVAVEGDIIGFLLDLDNNRVTTHKNGSYADGSGNHDESSPTAYVSITAPASTPLGGYMIGFDETVGSSEGSNQNTGTYEINFGNPTFSISSGNADANGYGNFEYAVPTGYFSLCTKNLAQYG